MNWFYESGGQQQGPVPEYELDRLLSEGKITPNTLVWREGMADWQPHRVARPTAAVPPPIPGHESAGEIPPGYVRCTLTGRIVPESEAIYIQGKPYSPEAKSQVLQALQSGGSVSLAEGERTGPAWEHRQELGWVTAAWETIRTVFTQPSATFRNMRREGGLGDPMLFYVIIGSLAAIFAQICLFLFEQSGVVPNGTRSFSEPITPTQLAITALFIPFWMAIGSLLSAGITHVCLMIVGGAKQSYETTFRVFCYAHGSASALLFIPICGVLVAGIWGIVLQAIGLARAHEITTGRALLAILLPMIVCCSLLALLFGGVMVFHQGSQ